MSGNKEWFPPQYLVEAMNETYCLSKKEREIIAEKEARFLRSVSCCIECGIEALVFVLGDVQHHPLYVCEPCRKKERVISVPLEALERLGGKHCSAPTDRG